MMERQQAIRFVTGAMNDYIGDLRKQGHRQAAEVMAANANAALTTLEADESTTTVPEDVSGSDPG